MEYRGRPLRLLSLDGGGIRGLSSIMILKDIMKGVNEGRPSSDTLQPWQVFDMIGGTSTGGLIAVMLGRLRMTLNECEDAYMRMSERIFKPKRSSRNYFGRSSDFLGANGRFDSEELEDAMKDIVTNHQLPEGSLLKDSESPCKVFVGAILTSNSRAVVLRTYDNPQMPELLYDSCTIWEACRATSAATTFFEPITIGPHGQKFADGAVRYNNPIQQVYREATNLWPQRISTALLISVGTGNVPGPPFEGNIAQIVEAMKQIVTETQSAADEFMYGHDNMVDQDLLFRFNVDQGLADVGLEEYKKRREIADATHAYLNGGETRQKWRKCVRQLRSMYSEVVTTPFTADEQECLQTLSFPEIEARRHNIDTALEKTCTWLFEHPEFLAWINRDRLNEHSGLLWIKGKPGAGKSTLMKQALQHTEQTFAGQGYAILGFFFNARGSSLEQTPLGLYRSLLHQLLRQGRSLLQEFLAKFQDKRRAHGSDWEWHLQELQHHVNVTVTRSKGCPIYVLIDALDECDESSVRQVVSFLTSSLDSALSTGARLSICLASRHYPNISVRRKLEIRVEGENNNDISKYVRAKLPIESNEEKELEEKVIEKASSVFMWVKLVVDMLVKAKDDGETTKRMREILEQCPPELDDLYKTLLGKLEDREKPMALKMIQWVLLAERPLTVRELRFALAFDTPVPYKSQRECQASDEFVRDDEQMERLLCSQSRGLLEVKHEQSGQSYAMRRGTEPIVQFIHESVRTLLECRKGLQILDPSLEETAIGKGHDSLVRSCINYLSNEDLLNELIPKPPSWYSSFYIRGTGWSTYPFLRYAVTAWPYHASMAESKGTAQTGLVERFTGPMNHVLQCLWIKLQGSQVSLLYIASKYKLLSCAKFLLDSRASVITLGGEYGSPLNVATRYGHETLVRLLLDRGADVSLQTSDFPKTALHLAVEFRRVRIVRLLLESGADIEAKASNQMTAMHGAVSSQNEAMVQLLLEKGADVTVKNSFDKTPLHMAVRDGSGTIVLLLLRQETDVATQHKQVAEALCLAVGYEKEALVGLLLRETDVANTYKGPALHLAVQRSNKAIAQMLLQNGVDVDARGDHERTPLHFAYDKEIAQLLLENGADIHARDDLKRTPLFSAAYHAEPETAQLLLEKGAHINTTDDAGWTSLHTTCNEQMGRLLLKMGANIGARDHHKRTPLFSAASQAKPEMVSLLLEKGADVHTNDDAGWTALHVAAENGHPWVVMVLLESGAEINAKNITGQSALDRAARSGKRGAAQLLLVRGANVDLTDDAGWTALHGAADGGHESMVEFLLDYGGRIDVIDTAGHTALDLARLKQRGDVVRCLKRALHRHAAAGKQLAHTLEPLQAHEADIEKYTSDAEDSSASDYSSMAWGKSRATQLVLETVGPAAYSFSDFNFLFLFPLLWNARDTIAALSFTIEGERPHGGSSIDQVYADTHRPTEPTKQELPAAANQPHHSHQIETLQGPNNPAGSDFLATREAPLQSRSLMTERPRTPHPTNLTRPSSAILPSHRVSTYTTVDHHTAQSLHRNSDAPRPHTISPTDIPVILRSFESARHDLQTALPNTTNMAVTYEAMFAAGTAPRTNNSTGPENLYNGRLHLLFLDTQSPWHPIRASTG